MKNKFLLSFVFSAIILLLLHSCDWFKNKKPVIIDYVEIARYEIYDGELNDVCGMYNRPCLIPICLKLYYTSGKIHSFAPICLKCQPGLLNTLDPSNRVVEFYKHDRFLAPVIKIKPHRAFPGLVVYTRSGSQTPFRNLCKEKYNSSELEGEKLNQLKNLLDVLVLRYGSNYGLKVTNDNPKDICLAISHSEPDERINENGNRGYVAGRINCWPGVVARARNCRYEIDLFEQAFARTNPCVQEVYNTVAHEFKHILQSIEFNLSCDRTSDREDLETEAENFANSLFPLCNDCNN